MKKVMLLAAVIVAALSINAQHVVPVSLNLTEYKLDSLRVQYVNDPVGYLAQLQQVEIAQKQDADELKSLQKQLKDEKNFAKERAGLLKDADKVLKQLEKDTQSSNKALISLRNGMEKSHRSIQKQSLVNQDAKETTTASISEYKALVEQEIHASSARLTQISKVKSSVASAHTGLESFNAEVASKEAKIKELEAKQKANVAEIKAQIKAAKEAVKAAKK